MQYERTPAEVETQLKALAHVVNEALNHGKPLEESQWIFSFFVSHVSAQMGTQFVSNAPPEVLVPVLREFIARQEGLYSDVSMHVQPS